MKKYLVTTEVRENLFKQLLRWIGANKKGNFYIILTDDFYKKGDILNGKIKILKLY